MTIKELIVLWVLWVIFVVLILLFNHGAHRDVSEDDE